MRIRTVEDAGPYICVPFLIAKSRFRISKGDGWYSVALSCYAVTAAALIGRMGASVEMACL